MDVPGGTTGRMDVGVTNTGDRSGSTVIFCYAGLPKSAFERPVRRLVAFARVALDAGRTTTVSLPFDLATLAVRQDGGWLQEPGRYMLEVGTDADRPTAAAEVDLTEPG